MDTELKVSGVMTAPRHEIVLARNYIEIAMRSAGVPLMISGGVFYGQCMQRAFEKLIRDGVDVAITVDFDSMFLGSDVHRLLSKLVNYDLDAVASLQCRRGKRFPLMTIAGQTSQVIDGSPFEVSTAHFGLTAINLHKLKDVPKPWFFSQPDANGEWSGDRIDDDIWFWKQWRDAGLKISIDPQTKIGHMEEMVTVFDDEMNPQHVYPLDWAEDSYGEKKKTGTLVYVGANIGGEHLDKLIEKHERCYLFEPQPFAAEKLRQTVGKLEGVEVIQAACGADEGLFDLTIYNEMGLSSSLGKMTQQAKDSFSDFDLEEREIIKVNVWNLLEWLEANGIETIETLVIDAQGMDLTILKTLSPLIETGAIQNIQCEADGVGFTHYEGLPSNSETEFQEFMSQFGWYTGDRADGRLNIQPDLIWKLTGEVQCLTVT